MFKALKNSNINLKKIAPFVTFLLCIFAAQYMLTTLSSTTVKGESGSEVIVPRVAIKQPAAIGGINI